MSTEQDLSAPAVAALLAVAIVLPPVGMVVGITGVRRAARARSRHAGRWYGAITVLALTEIAAVIGVALVGGYGGITYAVLGGLVAFVACLVITRSWGHGNRSQVLPHAQAKP